jgi:hypothetical protein
MSGKITDYYESFVKKAIKSTEQFNAFIKSDDLKNKFNTKELEELAQLWSPKAPKSESAASEVYKPTSFPNKNKNKK